VLGLACYAAVMIWGGLWTPGAFPAIGQFFVVSLGSSLLLLNGIFLDNRVNRFLGLRVWVPFARASYGQYLTHLFVVFWALGWWPRGDHSAAVAVAHVVAFCFVVLAVAVAVGDALYLAVIARQGDGGSRVAFVAGSIAAAGVAAAAAEGSAAVAAGLVAAWAAGTLWIWAFLGVFSIGILIIPAGIYLLSWYPFFARGQFQSFSDLVAYTQWSYSYHHTLTATHPYGSRPWSWPGRRPSGRR